MAQLKEIKDRIASVRNTLKITSSMKRVASAKFHRTQTRAVAFAEYEEPLRRIVAELQGDDSLDSVSPLVVDRGGRGRAVIVAFSSDSSFCGAFNANISRALTREVAALRDEGFATVDVWPVAERVAAYAAHEGYSCCRDYVRLVGVDNYDDVALLADRLMEEFLSGAVDRVEVLHSHYHSMSRQEPTLSTLLPYRIEIPAEASEREYILEPSPRELLAELLPAMVRTHLYGILLDSALAEHAARTVAMQTATDNAEELLDELTVTFNKRRQQAITDELSDITNSAF